MNKLAICLIVALLALNVLFPSLGRKLSTSAHTAASITYTMKHLR